MRAWQGTHTACPCTRHCDIGEIGGRTVEKRAPRKERPLKMIKTSRYSLLPKMASRRRNTLMMSRYKSTADHRALVTVGSIVCERYTS